MVKLAPLFVLGLVPVLAAIGSCREAKTPIHEDREANREVWYVSPAGRGAADGSSWANALEGLPDSLDRGSVYWLSAGNYGSYDFQDRDRGKLGIVVRKATAQAHGDHTGWKSDYGVGQAVFGPLHFEQGRYTLDGGERNGLKVVGETGTEAAIHVEGSHVVLRQIEIDGGFRKLAGKQTAGGCNGANVDGDHVMFDRCEIHNVADDGLGIYADHVRVLNTEIHDLDGCGTDNACGACYNGHSDGIEMSGASDVELTGNLVYDVRSNAGLYMDDWSGSAVQNLLVRNNIFYTPDTGFAVYVQKVKGAKVYDNVIWGKTQGSKYGGLSIGPGIEDLRMHDNIILNINFSHMGVEYDPKRHGLDNNVFGMINPDEYTAGPRDRIEDPHFRGVPMSDDAGDHRRTGLSRDDFEASRR